MRYCGIAEALAARLGLIPKAKVALVNVREETRALLPVDHVILYDRAAEPLDVLIYCSDELANMQRRAPVFAGFLRSRGRFWLGHPDPESELTTDITTEDARRIAVDAGLEPLDSLRLGDWRLLGFLKPSP